MGIWKKLFGRKRKAPGQERPSRQIRPDSSEKEEFACDVCASATSIDDGYSLTTEEVVPIHRYWEVLLKNRFPHLAHDDEKTATAFSELIAQQVNRSTGWLVCETCADLFEFDRGMAREYARQRIDPPHAGPLADPKSAVVAALTARLAMMTGA